MPEEYYKGACYGDTVTAKGQVTIPQSVRDMLGIAPGSKVDFHCAPDGSVVLTRADKKRPASRFEKLRGHADKGLHTDAIMALTRGEKAHSSARAGSALR
ncbi:AbrB/MazE/SpoVT family DNA-binding domain-containing protein [Rhizobium ecuadorense]|uniref:AbrB/MazE/SpoVT family DNA-binding domain-containing protein n=1 Tax=Rhizobium ecuadorense TaxID=1671795 RepID=UPI0009EC0665|nr:AbrB/MazE/SpoVT family DNA-binding domain-containing protein [Rhizobium ecuadorense]